MFTELSELLCHLAQQEHFPCVMRELPPMDRKWERLNFSYLKNGPALTLTIFKGIGKRMRKSMEVL